MRRAQLPRTSFVVAVCLAVVTLVGCSGAAPVSSAAGTQTGAPPGFPTGAVFDYQLSGAYDPAPEVRLVVRDRTDPPAAGLYSVCYVNAFQTQPDERDQWPADVLLTVDGSLVHDPGWPDEILLDTSTGAKRATIVATVSRWIEGCAEAGFAAVEFDNLDSFTRSRGALSLDDNLALAVELVRVAHEAGLAAGQKNTAEHTARLKQQAGFDFAIAEECAAWQECSAYTDVYGGAVIDVEYTDTLPRSFAAMCSDPASPRSMILRDRNLLTPADDGHVFQSCPA